MSEKGREVAFSMVLGGSGCGITVPLAFLSTNFSCTSALSFYVMLPVLIHPAKQEKESIVNVRANEYC